MNVESGGRLWSLAVVACCRFALILRGRNDALGNPRVRGDVAASAISPMHSVVALSRDCIDQLFQYCHAVDQQTHWARACTRNLR